MHWIGGHDAPAEMEYTKLKPIPSNQHHSIPPSSG